MQRGRCKVCLPVTGFCFRNGRPGIFVPMIVEPEYLASRVRHPHKLRNGIGQRMELTFACVQRCLRALAFGDLFGSYVDPDNLAG